MESSRHSFGQTKTLSRLRGLLGMLYGERAGLPLASRQLPAHSPVGCVVMMRWEQTRRCVRLFCVHGVTTCGFGSSYDIARVLLTGRCDELTECEDELLKIGSREGDNPRLAMEGGVG